jgi:hypothetical protein
MLQYKTSYSITDELEYSPNVFPFVVDKAKADVAQSKWFNDPRLFDPSKQRICMTLKGSEVKGKKIWYFNGFNDGQKSQPERKRTSAVR